MKNGPFFTRTRLSQAMAVAIVTFVNTPAMAGSGSCVAGANVISTAETVTCGLDTGDSLVVTPTGSIITATTTGVYADGVIGSITNNGTIDPGAGPFVYGIHIDESIVSGDITNTGYLGSVPSYAALYVYSSTIDGSIVNTGTIDGTDWGMYIYDSTITGDIVNEADGLIEATTYFGIYTYAAIIDGDIVNRGTIDAADTGLYLYDDTHVKGNVINEGLIDAGDKGIYVYSSIIDGDIINKGTIDAASDTAIYVYGKSIISGSIVNEAGAVIHTGDQGIWIETSTVGGDIINRGTIDTDDDAGIYIYGATSGTTVNGSIINEGTILGDDGGIYIYGSTIGGDIVNKGTIETLDDQGLYVYGAIIGGHVVNEGLIESENQGIWIGAQTAVNGDVVNKGTIETLDDAGIYIYGEDTGNTITGSVINEGTILGDDGGIYIYSSSIGGDVLNKGSIVTEDDQGLYIYGSSIGGDIVNEGLIKTGVTGDPQGIWIQNATLSGDLINRGTIDTASATSEGAGLYLYGGDVNIVGSIINEGLIKSRTYGMYVYSTSVGGDIINRGTIDTTDDDNSAGIYVYSDSIIAGSIINEGVILGEDGGIYIYGSSVGGDVVNKGTIDTMDDQGLYIYGSSVGGDVINEGVIASERQGIWIQNETIGGDLINRGTIETAEAGDGAGLYVYGGEVSITGSIINEGLIDSKDFGMYIYSSTVGGDIINRGTIETGDDAGMYIYSDNLIGGHVINEGVVRGEDRGIYIYSSSIGGDVINSGLIEARNNQGLYLYASTVVGDVVNEGTIEAGTGSAALYIYGSTIGGDMVVNSGTLLGGVNIDIDVPVTNSGTFHTRYYESYVDGDYTQTSSGVFRFSAVDDTTFGSLEVGGTATFASKISVDVDPAHSLADGDVLDEVIDAGDLVATSFTVGDNILPLSFTADIKLDDTVDLSVSATGLTTIAAAAQSAGLKAGPAAAGQLDALIAADPSGELAFAFGSLSTAQGVANAVESALPALSGGLGQASLGIAGAVTNVVGSRQDAVNGVASGDEYLANKYIWIAPFGGWTEQDSRNGVSGYDIDSYGLAVGMDADTSSSWNVGAAIAFSESEVDGDVAAGSHDVDVQTVLGKIYATYKLDAVTAINLQAGVGASDNDSKRRIFTGAVAKADYDSKHYLASAELERRYQTGANSSLTPYVHVDYNYVDVDSYTETGAGLFNLTVNDDDADSLVLGIGVRGNLHASDNLALLGDIGVGYDAEADRSKLTSSFAGGGANFTTAGIKPADVLYNIGLGMRYTLGSGSMFIIRYDFDGRDDYTDQALTTKIKWKF